MALSGEQRAVLDLLLGRGLDLDRIAQLTRVPVTDVRGRARGALAAIGDGDPGEDVAALLLGHATPDAQRRARAALAADPVARERAARIAQTLQVGWPGYDAPDLPEPDVGADAARAPAPRPGSRTWTWALVGGAVVAAVLVVLAATGRLAGGDDAERAAGPDPSATPAPVLIALRAPGATADAGRATIGSTVRFEPYLDLELDDLPAAPRGRVFLLWADTGEGRGFPLPVGVEDAGGQGRFARRYDLPPALAPVLGRSRAIELLAADAGRLARLQREVERLGDGSTSAAAFPRRPGTVVLRGVVPR